MGPLGDNDIVLKSPFFLPCTWKECLVMSKYGDSENV